MIVAGCTLPNKFNGKALNSKSNNVGQNHPTQNKLAFGKSEYPTKGIGLAGVGSFIAKYWAIGLAVVALTAAGFLYMNNKSNSAEIMELKQKARTSDSTNVAHNIQKVLGLKDGAATDKKIGEVFKLVQDFDFPAAAVDTFKTVKK